MVKEIQGTSLQMAVIPQSYLDDIKDGLEEIKTLFREKSKAEIGAQWIESTEVRKKLGVSQKTWQTYRDERRIPFSQFGRKIYVKRSDLEKFMEEHYINAR
ncbi:MAG: helix-turn-helix domain-containing protein [Bacteroidales bacterium]|nr:helix-turn-helix domain-containing protein [Bacteroidales bacterium]